MDNVIEFIMGGSTTWTPEVFIRFVLLFTVLEGVFAVGSILAYLGKRL